jgi:hypothetical protein
MLVISGGEGYIDFRVGDGEDGGDCGFKTPGTISASIDTAHLIIWQVSTSHIAAVDKAPLPSSSSTSSSNNPSHLGITTAASG